MGRVTAFLHELRSRPHHERAILAGITYAAAAAVVIAVAITSLQSSLRLGEPAAAPAASSGSAPLARPEVLTEPELAAPLDALSDALRDFRRALEKLSEFTSSRPGAPEPLSKPPEGGNPAPAGSTELAEWASRLPRVVGYNLGLLREWLIDFANYWIR